VLAHIMLCRDTKPSQPVSMWPDTRRRRVNRGAVLWRRARVHPVPEIREMLPAQRYSTRRTREPLSRLIGLCVRRYQFSQLRLAIGVRQRRNRFADTTDHAALERRYQRCMPADDFSHSCRHAHRYGVAHYENLVDSSGRRILNASIDAHSRRQPVRDMSRARNIMKHAMRWHDFGSGREERPAA
jgi:hypothetical protein